MQVRLIDFGCPTDRMPKRAHPNDVGADVFCPVATYIPAGEVAAIPLGFGVEVPAGWAAFIFPRSSWAKNGWLVQLPPIDPGYNGEVHAIVHNTTKQGLLIQEGWRIGQLVFLPVGTPEFVWHVDDSRGSGAFGSTGV